MDDTAKVIGALREKFPLIQGPRKDDICYATTNRQDAVRQLALECGLVLVVGSQNSSNSNRLRELAERCGAESYLINGPECIRAEWLEGKAAIGITAGASAPEVLVERVIERLQGLGAQAPEELDGIPENISFSLPRELRRGEQTFRPQIKPPADLLSAKTIVQSKRPYAVSGQWAERFFSPAR